MATNALGQRGAGVPSALEARKAITAVEHAVVNSFARLPPELSEQMGNIWRCLIVAESALLQREAHDRSGA